MARGDPATGLDDGFALLILQVKACDITAKPIGDEIERIAILLHVEGIGVEEHAQNFFRVVPEGTHQHGSGQLPAPVDPHENRILRIEFEVEPGAAIGNNPSAVEQLPGGVGLAPIMVEEHPGGTVQLGNNDPLRTVDDEGAVLRHHGHFAHVDFLLFDFLDGLVARLFIVDDELDRHPKRHGVGGAPENAFFNVEGGLAEAIAHVIQGSIARVARDGENGFEGRVQPRLQTFRRRPFCLEETLVGL